jgi:hypothetical protein
VVLILLALAGCGRATVPKPPEDKEDEQAPQPLLEAAVESLRKGAASSPGEQAYLQRSRHAVDLLNRYLHALGKEPADIRFKAGERSRLKEQVHLDEAELNELEKPEPGKTTFTPLDAHYLGLCFLLADGAESLDLKGLPRLEQARVAFDWVTRQVSLKSRVRPANRNTLVEDDLVPPEDVLLLGHGSATERALVYLALLRQLGIDGCMIAVPGKDGRMAPWIPGALVPKEEKDFAGNPVPAGIYLFDTRLGMPLPGPDGKGVARLADVVEKPDQFRRLFTGPGAEAVIPPQIAKAEVRLACPLSALSPRMRHLQEKLASSSGKIVLAMNPEGLRGRFEKVTRKPVQVWNGPGGDTNNPTRVLRAFLPPEAGGVGNPARVIQLYDELHQSALLARTYPRTLRSELHKYLQFVPNSYAIMTLGPRHLMLTGRTRDAIRLLNQGQEEFRQYRTVFTGTPAREKEQEQKVEAWCSQLEKAKETLLRIQPEGRDGGKDTQQIDAQKRLNDLLNNREIQQTIIYQCLAEPLGKETAYLLTLCMQDQAERLQTRLAKAGKAATVEAQDEVRNAWREANRSWATYCDGYGLTGSSLKERLKDLADTLRQGADKGPLAAALYESLSLDLSRTAAARLAWSRALGMIGQEENAERICKQLLEDLQGWTASLEELRRYFVELFQRGAALRLTNPYNLTWLRVATQLELNRIQKSR